SPPTVQTGDGGAGSDVDMGQGGGGDEYTVDVGENDQRTMTVAQIVEAYNTGVITADTYVWKDGMGDWAALADVVEINDALHAAAAAQAPAAPAAYAAPAQEAPRFTASSFGGASKSPSVGGGAGGRAATTSAFGGAGADLFGGIDTAGSESEVTTSAPDGGGGITAATGARNESSVLFSLSA